MAERHESVHQMFSRMAARLPGRPAIESRGRSITYRELEEQSDRLAGALLAHGTPRGSRVAILAEDAAEIIAAILATLKAGFAFVPLDTRLPEARQARMAAQVAPAWYLCEAPLAGRAARLAVAAGGPAKGLLLGAGEASEPLSAGVAPGNPPGAAPGAAAPAAAAGPAPLLHRR